MYLGIIISLIDPKDMTRIRELFGTMGGFLDAFGIDISMVFYVIQNMSLIAKPVDTGAMAYTLSMLISRAKVALTQGSYLIFAMAVHAVLMFTVGVFCFWQCHHRAFVRQRIRIQPKAFADLEKNTSVA